MITIKRPSRTDLTLVIDQNTVLSQRLMTEDLIYLNVVVSSPLDLLVGDYITYNTIKYEINRPVKFRKVSGVEYRYEVQFEAPMYRMLDKIVQISDASEFSLSGNCEDFVDLIVSNMNLIDTNWLKGTITPPNTDPLFWQTLSLNNNNCRELLDMIATTFACEWSIADKTISIYERVENETALSFEVGKGHGLYELSRENVDTENTVTRIFVYGSSKNLPIPYRGGLPRLVIGTPSKLERFTEYAKTVEKVVIFEGIYPRFTGEVDTVSADLTAISCTTVDFDVNDHLIPDTTAKVVFLSGDLSGMQFEISSFTDASNEIKLVPINEDGFSYPSTNFHPHAGDKFTFIDITMPASYVTAAEELLEDAGTLYLNYYSQLRVKYALTLDARYIRDNAISLNIGDKIQVVDSVLGIDKTVRITALKASIDKSQISAEISNYKDEIWEKQIKNALNDAINKVTQIGNNNVVYINSTTNNSTTNNQFINNTDGRSVILSGANIWQSGLTYKSSIFEYLIFGVPYTAPVTTTTLQPADPTLGRIDSFWLDTFGKLGVTTGTPAENPTSPILGPYQLFVHSVMIPAGATEPYDVNVVVVYDEQEVTEWTTSVTVDNFVTAVFNDTTNPANGTKRIKVLVDVPNTEVHAPLHYIGEHYQGGIIFYLATDGKSGLIVSESDVATDVFYSNISGTGPFTTGADGVNIGDGKDNSDLMLANNNAKDDAVRFCDEFISETYTDWFMPCQEELKSIHLARFKLTGLGTKTYWSSTEVQGGDSDKKAICISFGNGTAYVRDKNNRYAVRAIRAFNDLDITSGVLVPTLKTVNTTLSFATTTPVSVNDGILSMLLYSSLEWQESSGLLVRAYKGAMEAGATIINFNSYSYKSGEDTWQLIAIPIKNFNITGTPTIDCFKISLIGNWTNKIDFGIDVIRYQFSAIQTKSDGTLQIGKRLIPLPDGVITEFSTPTPFRPGTTKIYVNGVKMALLIDYVEASGKIVFMVTPLEGEILTADYYTV